MNERVKKLAMQADKEAFPHGSMAWMQTFADLIVRECAQIVAENSLPDAYSEPCLVLIAEEIKEHFGVEL